MKLGLIARCDNRGLGQQTWQLYRHLHPVKTMVVDCPSAKPLAPHYDRFPGAQVVHGLPTEQDCRTFLQGIDTVISCETFYRAGFADLARSMGVKTVLQLNREFLDVNDRPDLWAAPSMWHYEDIPEPKTFLPVPIDVKCQETAGRTTVARNFAHIVGRPAIHDRNGTADLLLALQYVTAQVTVSIRCQEAGYVSGLVHQHNIRTPNNVILRVESGDAASNTELYAGQDVLVMPRRFGGLCLPVNEALGHGMPVVMPSISPNITWLPEEWLTPASLKTSFRAKQHVDVYQTDPRDLAQLLDRFATDTEFYTAAQKRARQLADSLSWESLRGTYIRTLEQL